MTNAIPIPLQQCSATSPQRDIDYILFIDCCVEECTVVEGDVINKDDTDEGIDKRKNNGLENDGNDNVEI